MARGRKRALFGHKTTITSTITHEAIQNIKKTLCVSEGMHCVWEDGVYCTLQKLRLLNQVNFVHLGLVIF